MNYEDRGKLFLKRAGSFIHWLRDQEEKFGEPCKETIRFIWNDVATHWVSAILSIKTGSSWEEVNREVLNIYSEIPMESDRTFARGVLLAYLHNQEPEPHEACILGDLLGALG